jgi:hypothetical protein
MEVINKINEILIQLVNLNNKVDNVNDKAEQTSLSVNKKFDAKLEELSNKMVILEAGVPKLSSSKFIYL